MYRIKSGTDKNKIIFIIALLLMNVRVNFVGSISFTELFVLTQIPHLLKWMNVKGRKIPYLCKVVNGFYLLIVVQCIAEYMVHNSIINAVKGIAVTFMALFLMLFFLEKLLKDISLLIWMPICSIISLLLFGDQFGYAEKSDMTYFKFYVAPIVAYSVCAATLIRWKWFHKNVIILLFVAALFIIIGGARSLGFSLLFTVGFYRVIIRYRNIKLRKILPGLLIVGFIVQLFLTFVYMPKVKSGEWGSEQNREQFAMINWNSNIFAILFVARTDFFVSTIAFMDKPLWGFGSWAKDYTGEYHILQSQLIGDEYRESETIGYVPCHSVVMGKGVSNGIFAFIVFLWIFITVYKVGCKAIYREAPYTIFLLWIIISSFQHLMFGPPAILKNNGASAFAVMFALFYLKYKMDNEKKNNVIGSNCNL